MIAHGGNLGDATARFGLPKGGWLDLSTGISPWSYPVGNVPDFVWRCLPDDLTPLVEIASAYYEVPFSAITPVPGSQYAIRNIPQLVPKNTVAIPLLGYQEHEYHWRSAGHTIVFYETAEDLKELALKKMIAHAIIINPNNPSTEYYSRGYLSELSTFLPEEGVLLIDEAFIDCYPQASMFIVDHPGIIILRSVGKFFGLAGIRLGFVLGGHPIIKQLEKGLTPWGINHPAAWIAQQALQDDEWCRQQRQRITDQESRLRILLSTLKFFDLRSAKLFLTIFDGKARLSHFHQLAAYAGIWLRYQVVDDKRAWLRVGLPGNGWSKLEKFINSI